MNYSTCRQAVPNVTQTGQEICRVWVEILMTSVSKVWLTVSRFSRNAGMFGKFLFTAYTHIFIKI